MKLVFINKRFKYLSTWHHDVFFFCNVTLRIWYAIYLLIQILFNVVYFHISDLLSVFVLVN